MLTTHEMLVYIRARANIADAAFDDPVLLQAELDGYAVREDGKWRVFGIIQPGERRTVRHCYGPPSVIVGTEELRARCEAELRNA